MSSQTRTSKHNFWRRMILQVCVPYRKRNVDGKTFKHLFFFTNTPNCTYRIVKFHLHINFGNNQIVFKLQALYPKTRILMGLFLRLQLQFKQNPLEEENISRLRFILSPFKRHSFGKNQKLSRFVTRSFG